MATISRTGIAGGSLISPTHITNIIDALDGTGVGITVVATGSFSGSLVGNATTATSASYALTATSASFAPPTFPYTGSARISGSLQVTGSTSILGGDVTISGSSTTKISMYTNKLDGNLLATNNLIFDLSQLGRFGGTGKFGVPTTIPSGSVPAGTMYWDDAGSRLFIYSDTVGDWLYATFSA